MKKDDSHKDKTSADEVIRNGTVSADDLTQEMGTRNISDYLMDEAVISEDTQARKGSPQTEKPDDLHLYNPLDELTAAYAVHDSEHSALEIGEHLDSGTSSIPKMVIDAEAEANDETDTEVKGKVADEATPLPTFNPERETESIFELDEKTTTDPVPPVIEPKPVTANKTTSSDPSPEKTFSGAKIKHNLRLGEILLKYTQLEADQLQEALMVQETDGGLLGDILVKLKMVTPIDIMKALCLQLGIEFRDDLKGDDINPELVAHIRIDYAKNKSVVPLEITQGLHGEELLVAMANPFNQEAIEDLQVLSGKPVRVVASPKAKVLDAINRVYEKSSAGLLGEEIETGFEENYDIEGPIDILEGTENDPPVIRFVNSLLFSAVKERVSDIHIEPYEREFVVRFRKDGVLFDKARHPKHAAAAITSRIKVMGQLDIAEKRMPQDGRIKIKLAGKDVDIRLSTVPVAFGERVVMRILEQGNTVLQLEDLGFPRVTQDKMDNLINRKFGIVLVTGPTGSGKSTTLSACLVRLNNKELNIMTVEDPIEYQINGISQVQVNTKIELTFAKALRHFLRQDPDIIMVGEIRDKETAEIAINASLTGHLVLSTIHTNDAAGAITRLIDMGVEPFLVASSLIGIVAQRLVRKVCTVCRRPHKPSEFEMMEMGITQLPAQATIFKAVGCPACSQSGYSGRTVISEMLIVDEEIRKFTVDQADSAIIKKSARKSGMETLRENGLKKVFSGATTIEELTRVTHTET